ncbi:MAG: serine/threonine-protein kinase, partial [Burkholderiaceae bacterium]|nr:serine/threonine-protein kinase [Burkholderiaceae bacterium]
MTARDTARSALHALLDDGPVAPLHCRRPHLLSLPAQSRDAFVQQLDGERAQYRDTLRALLAHTAGVETDQWLPTLTGVFERAEAGPPLTDLVAGTQIGPYRLLDELGSGGMGSVWRAERVDGALTRQVALKLPRLAWGKGLAERMARERDILAALEHPHIARLYDAGADRHGRPYLALEYVAGQPIDRYCQSHALDVKARLSLLLQICSAVAFAHGRLVVHRDLKPSNILVTPDGQVRLLDFGIAKLMEGDRAEETQLTRLAGRALTLDYASPEQIAGAPIGTASDVYSLGVVAYELLTGSRPYKLKRGSAAELEEAIASADPAVASEVASDPQSRRALRGDLDAILNKALKKAPAARYPTVDALAQDIARHLSNEPVSAQPDAFAYRAGKFLRRYRVQSAAAAAVLASLAVGVGVALWQAGEAQRQRDLALSAAQAAEQSAARADTETQKAREQERAAEQARAAAEQAAVAARDAALQAQTAAAAERRAARQARDQSARAEAVQDYLVGIFQQSSARQPDPKKAQSMTARELLDFGAERLDRDLAAQPAARLQMAGTLTTLYLQLGLTQQALPPARSALALADSLHGPTAAPTLAALGQLHELLRTGGGDAAELARVTARIERTVSAPAAPSNERLRLLRSLAIYASDRNRPDAMTLAERALREAQALGNALRIAEAEGIVGRVAERRGEWARAERHLTASVAAATRVPGVVDFDLTITRAMLANAQSNQLRIPEAEATLRQLLADTAARLTPDHIDAAQIRYRLASMLVSVGRVEDGWPMLQALVERLARQGPDRELLKSLVMADLGIALRELGDLDGAERHLRESIAVRDRLRPGSVPAAAQREDLAVLLALRGRHDEARALLDEADRLRTALGDDRPGRLGWERLQLRRSS